jgi:hypothetical protein
MFENSNAGRLRVSKAFLLTRTVSDRSFAYKQYMYLVEFGGVLKKGPCCGRSFEKRALLLQEPNVGVALRARGHKGPHRSKGGAGHAEQWR